MRPQHTLAFHPVLLSTATGPRHVGFYLDLGGSFIDRWTMWSYMCELVIFFPNQIIISLDTLILYIHFSIIKINDFRGDLSDTSATTATLVCKQQICCGIVSVSTAAPATYLWTKNIKMVVSQIYPNRRVLIIRGVNSWEIGLLIPPHTCLGIDCFCLI